MDDIKKKLQNRVSLFNKEDFISNVCNDKYILVIGSEVILNKETYADVNGDIHQYILKALNYLIGRKDKPYATLNALIASCPSVSTGNVLSGADLIRSYLNLTKDEEIAQDDDSLEELDYDDEDDDDSEDENGIMLPLPTLMDLSPELYDLLSTRLFRFVMTTTFDANVELLMRIIWRDELRVVNIANKDDWRKFQMEVASTLDRSDFSRTTYKWNRPTLIYIFGKATTNTTQNFVKTENDAIEFIEKWMKLGGKEDAIVPMLMERRILALGCKFDDWYFRFFWYILRRDFEKLGEGEVALSYDEGDQNDLNLKKYFKSKKIYLHKDARQFMRDIIDMLTPSENNIQSKIFYEIIKNRRGNGEIFLSYASHDFVLASRLFMQLTDKGYNVWFDHKSLCGGNYEREIKNAINSAKIVITLLTPKIAEDLIKKDIDHFYNKEWQLASQFGAERIIPVAANGYSLRAYYHTGGDDGNGNKITTYEDIIRGHENGVNLMNDDFEKLLKIIDNKK